MVKLKMSVDLTIIVSAMFRRWIVSTGENNKPKTNPQRNSGFRSDGSTRFRKMDDDALPAEPVPRVLPKDKDPSLVKHNRRILGQPLGTLEKEPECTCCEA